MKNIGLSILLFNLEKIGCKLCLKKNPSAKMKIFFGFLTVSDSIVLLFIYESEISLNRRLITNGLTEFSSSLKNIPSLVNPLTLESWKLNGII